MLGRGAAGEVWQAEGLWEGQIYYYCCYQYQYIIILRIVILALIFIITRIGIRIMMIVVIVRALHRGVGFLYQGSGAFKVYMLDEGFIRVSAPGLWS